MRVSGRAASIARDPLTEPERRDAFLAHLARMSREERLRAARHEFDRWQRAVWAGHYPEEVPTVGGEAEWIARRLADNLD
jgi:hypothetical protein